MTVPPQVEALQHRGANPVESVEQSTPVGGNDVTPDPNSRPFWGMPTNKWFVTQITALAALATMWATTKGWDLEETVAAIGLVSQAAISYFTPNNPAPGGVRPSSD